MSPRIWGTNFAAPSAPTGLLSSWDERTSWLTLTWDAYVGDAAQFAEWHVYRQVGAGELERIDDGRSADPDLPVFVDYDAPLGIPLHYVLTLSNGALESGGVDVDDEITLTGWYIGVPGDDAHSFRLLYEQPGATRYPDVGKTTRWPLGRSGALSTSGPVRKASGALTVQVEFEDYRQVRLLREIAAIAATRPYVVLKNSMQEAFRIQMSGISETYGRDVVTQAGFSWWAV